MVGRLVFIFVLILNYAFVSLASEERKVLLDTRKKKVTVSRVCTFRNLERLLILGAGGVIVYTTLGMANTCGNMESACVDVQDQLHKCTDQLGEVLNATRVFMCKFLHEGC